MGKSLTKLLREYIAGCPSLPVTKNYFLIDILDENHSSLSLQMGAGSILEEDIDGYVRIQQPFTLLYKDSFGESATRRANMQNTLNAIGEWLKETTIINPQDDYEFESFEISQTANILSQDAKDIIYQAGYNLIYNKTQTQGS